MKSKPYHCQVLPDLIGYRHLPIEPGIASLLLQEAVHYNGEKSGDEPNSLIVSNDCRPFGALEGRVLQQILSARAGLTARELAEVLHQEGYGVFLLMPSKDLIVPQTMKSAVIV